MQKTVPMRITPRTRGLEVVDLIWRLWKERYDGTEMPRLKKKQLQALWSHVIPAAIYEELAAGRSVNLPKVGTLAAREPELIDGLDPYGRPVRKLKAAPVRFRIDSRLRSHLK